MKLRHHIGSILFVVAAVASGAYAAIDARGRGPKVDESRVFGAFDHRAVLRIELTRGDERLVLERSKPDADLVMTSPARGTVDRASVEQLRTLLEAATVVREVPGATLSNAPRVRGRLTSASGTLQFALAEPAPTPDGAAYLDIEPGRRVVVRRELVAELLRPFDAYRDRALLPLGDDDLAKIEIRTPSVTFAVERNKQGLFRGPTASRVPRDLVERWLDAVPDLRASSFLSDKSAPTGAPTLQLSFTSKSGETRAASFFGPCPGEPRDVIAVAPRTGEPPFVACVAHRAADAFTVDPSALVDTRLFWSRIDELSEITIEPAAASAASPAASAAASAAGISLARVGSGFRERRPGNRDLDPAESEAATALLSQILGIRGSIAMRNDRESPALRVGVGRAGAEEVERLEIFDSPTGAVARRVADDVWLALTPEARRAIEPPPGGIRAPWLVPRSFSADSLSRMGVRCGGELTILKSDTGMVIESPRAVPLDVARAIDLIELLHRTRGRAVVPVTDAEAKRQTCTVQLSWQQDGGRTDLTIALLERSLGGTTQVIALRAGERDGIVVGDDLLTALSEPLVDRGALAWNGTGNPVLANLRASRVERLGQPLPREAFDKPLLEIKAGPVTYRFVRRDAATFLVRRSDLDVTFAVSEENLPRDLVDGGKP